MNVNQELSAKIQRWSEAPPELLDKVLVHKHQAENVLVSRIEPLAAGQPDSFLCQLFFDPKHAFFFEHPLDHVPGLMLIEAGRQAAIAIAHLYLGVSHDTVFIVNKLNTEFKTFAELDKPLFLIGTIRDKQYLNGELHAFRTEGNFIQNERSLGFVNGTATIYDKSIYHQLRDTP